MSVSIVVTTQNRLPLLKRAIESSLSQTLPCQVVVSDDGSTDGTEAYLRQLSASLPADRLVYCRSEVASGHAAAMNAGVAAAQGEWIKPLDDDDYLDDRCIAEMMSVLRLRPQAAIASCQAAQVNLNDQEVSRTRRVGPGRACYVPQADIHAGMLLERVPFGTPVQVMFRRDAFLQSGGWDCSLTVCDDIDSWIRIAEFGDAVFLNECLAYRTLWAGSNNQKVSVQQRLAANLLIKQKIYDRVPEPARSQLPPIEDLQNYVRLHWGAVALKQRQVGAALQIAFPAALSPAAWKLLKAAIAARRQPTQPEGVRKLVLVDS